MNQRIGEELFFSTGNWSHDGTDESTTVSISKYALYYVVWNTFVFSFHLDPSGTFIDCMAKSIGAASDGAEQSLKEQYHEVNFFFSGVFLTLLFCICKAWILKGDLVQSPTGSLRKPFEWTGFHLQFGC